MLRLDSPLCFHTGCWLDGEECHPGRRWDSNGPARPPAGSWWSRSMCRDVLLNDVPGVHLRDVITVWIWNLLLLLHRQSGRLRWLWLLLLLLLPIDEPVSLQVTPQGRAQDSQGKSHFWKQVMFLQPSRLLSRNVS